MLLPIQRPASCRCLNQPGSHLLVALAAIATLSLFSATPVASLANEASAPLLDPSVSRPSSIAEVLSNLKVAYDDGLLAKADFYTDINIGRFVGAQRLTATDSDKGLRINLSGFDAVAPPILRSGRSDEALWVTSFIDKASGSARVTVSIAATHVAPDFASTVAIFGPRWTEDNAFRSPHRVYKAPTAPHGNARIRYGPKPGGEGDSIIIEFDQDARVETVTFTTT
jgi:hypothetical protein